MLPELGVGGGSLFQAMPESKRLFFSGYLPLLCNRKKSPIFFEIELMIGTTDLTFGPIKEIICFVLLKWSSFPFVILSKGRGKKKKLQQKYYKNSKNASTNKNIRQKIQSISKYKTYQICNNRKTQTHMCQAHLPALSGALSLHAHYPYAAYGPVQLCHNSCSKTIQHHQYNSHNVCNSVDKEEKKH